jgi:hypothetical protein
MTDSKPIAAGVSIGEPTPVDRKCEPSGSNSKMACGPIAAGEMSHPRSIRHEGEQTHDDTQAAEICGGDGRRQAPRRDADGVSGGEGQQDFSQEGNPSRSRKVSKGCEVAPAEPVVTKLVGRLRAEAGCLEPIEDIFPLLREAADTITRLEADEQAWRDRERFLENTLTALLSERDRLKEALEKIVPSNLTVVHAALDDIEWLKANPGALSETEPR